MAERHRAHTHRHDEAQSTNHSDHDPARKTQARMQRAKEATRYRHREFAAIAQESDERSGPGIGDRQGEVA